MGWARGGLGGSLVAELRFCAYQYPHLSLEDLQQRWRDAERLGFDVLWNSDTVVEPDRARHVLFDGPATLTMMAAETSAIRVGTLVSSLYFRHPVTLAKAAMTVDHLSGGRLEVAIGVGDPSAGARAAGVDWTAGERVARFREFVELLDLLLRQEVTSYQGKSPLRTSRDGSAAGAASPPADDDCGARPEDVAHRGRARGRVEFLGAATEWRRRMISTR